MLTILTVMAAVPAAGSLSPACTILLNSPPVLTARQDRSRDEIRESYKAVVRRAAAHNKPDPLEVTPELLLLYWELGKPGAMPAYERQQMLRGLKVRLELQWKRLARMQKAAERKSRRSPRTIITRGRSKPVLASNAGPEAAEVAALIRLIRNTIQPDSWDVNGGLGRISFLGDPYYVLVIRNTGEVHNQIGGVLRP